MLSDRVGDLPLGYLLLIHVLFHELHIQPLRCAVRDS